MVDVDVFDRHRVHRNGLPRADLDQLRRFVEPEFAQFVFNDPESEPCSVYRNIDLSEQVGDRADVILVSVGQKNRAETVGVFDDILHIGNYVIDAGQILVGKSDTAVDCYYVLSAFYESQVFTYFVKPSERDNSYFVNSFQMKNSSL